MFRRPSSVEANCEHTLGAWRFRNGTAGGDLPTADRTNPHPASAIVSLFCSGSRENAVCSEALSSETVREIRQRQRIRFGSGIGAGRLANSTPARGLRGFVGFWNDHGMRRIKEANNHGRGREPDESCAELVDTSTAGEDGRVLARRKLSIGRPDLSLR